MYVLASATYSFLSSAFTAIYVYTVAAIVTLVLSILQLAVGIVCALLSKKSPKVARIVLIVVFILFAISELLNIIFYIIDSSKFNSFNFLGMITPMLVLAFEIVVLIALFLMKIKVENGEEAESTPLAKKELLPKQEISQEEKLNLLLKYKSLLDQGVITQEEFDAKKKELL